MIITLTEEQLNFAHNVGFKRSASVGHAVTKKSFNAYENKKPDWWRHYIGAIGELAYSIYIGKEIDTTTIGRGDDGTDFDNGVDVKSSDLNRKPNLLLGINQFNKKYAKRYVLAWVQIPKVELIGYIDKSTIKNFGYNDNYFVNSKDLIKL